MKEKFILINTYNKKLENSQVSTLEELDKEEQIMPQVRRRKGLIEIRAEMKQKPENSREDPEN